MFSWASISKGSQTGKYIHAAVAVGHEVYSFGGHSGTKPCQQMGVSVFNIVSLSWLKLPPVTTGTKERPLEVPSMHTHHTAVLIGDAIYIWGGNKWDPFGQSNVLYAFEADTHRWFKPRVSGRVPKARSHHSACVLGKVMFVHGGYIWSTELFSTHLSTNDIYKNDIYKLDTSTMAWSFIKSGGTPPPVSSGHSATIIRTKMFVCGGMGNPQFRSDQIKVFDTDTNCWLPSAQIPPEGHLPGRCHSAFTYHGELYIYGGSSKRTFNELWKLNPETLSWKKVEPKGKGPCWISLKYCCMVGDRVVLFGGCNGYILDLNPKLKTLCKLAVTQYGLGQSELTHNIRWELAATTKASAKKTARKRKKQNW